METWKVEDRGIMALTTARRMPLEFIIRARCCKDCEATFLTRTVTLSDDTFNVKEHCPNCECVTDKSFTVEDAWKEAENGRLVIN